MNASSVSTQELLDSNSLARGLAIWAVVACHIPFAGAYWKPLWMFASAGKLAVSIFLFSSGLLLQYQVNRADGRLRVLPWLRKRARRIYPVYWAGLALTVFCAWAFRQKVYSPGTFAANVLGIPLLLGRKAVSAGYTVPFWFISVLLLCYLLFPAACRLRRKGFLVLGALVVSWAALRTGCIMQAASLGFPSFFMGMAMADWLVRRGETPVDARIQAGIFLPLLGILAVVFKFRSFLHLGHHGGLAFDMLGCVCLTVIPASALYLIAVVQKMLARFAPALLKALWWVSGLTFAVYCIHEPLLVVLDKSTAAGHPWFGLTGYVFLTILLAWGLDAADRYRRNRRA